MPVAYEISANARRQERNDRNICLRPQLAGETNCRIFGRARSRKYEFFAPRRLRQCTAVADDANSAGRAASTPAAHAGMGDPVAEARFQDAQSFRHADLSVRV